MNRPTNRPINRNHWLGAILGIVAASGFAHSALAQVTWSGGSGARHVDTTQPSPQATTRTIVRSNDDRTMMMSGTTDNGDRYEIKIKNDDVKATLNGKQVPDNRIRISDSGVELLDADGSVVVTMNTNQNHAVTMPPIPAMPRLITRFGTSPGADENVFVSSIAAEPPKVMVGINMSEVGATLREHFGLEEDAGFVVDSVVDGLPASNAGIRERDIVLSIDGQNVTNATLRDTLNQKEPGQTVKVRILRKGEQKDLSLTLEAYDASKLGIGTTAPNIALLNDVPLRSFYFDGSNAENNEEVEMAMEEARRALEEAMAQVDGSKNESMREASEQMRQALTEMRRSQERRAAEGMRRSQQGGANRFFVVPPTPAAPPGPDSGTARGSLTPATPSAPRAYQLLRDPVAGSASPADAERMAQLEGRLDELNGRLDRLDDRIGRLLDRLERGN